VDAALRYPFLRAAGVAYAASDAMLWRVDPSAPAAVAALGCDGKPAAASLLALVSASPRR
jgi:hypothetical protein